jgi:hypothetical protein
VWEPILRRARHGSFHVSFTSSRILKDVKLIADMDVCVIDYSVPTVEHTGCDDRNDFLSGVMRSPIRGDLVPSGNVTCYFRSRAIVRTSHFASQHVNSVVQSYEVYFSCVFVRL